MEAIEENQFEYDHQEMVKEHPSEVRTPRISFVDNSEPIWDLPEPLERGYIRKLNQAEKLILSVASIREISPSDPELQARLEVGRPRMSQLFNKLKRNGFLKVRKEGRTRFFKLTEEAFDVLR